MVVIRGFREVEPSARRRRTLSSADCELKTFDDPGAGRVLELATTGSDHRTSVGKRSQTIQLDRAAALTLLGLMEQAFGESLLTGAATAVQPAGTDPVLQPVESTAPVDLGWPAVGGITLPEVQPGRLEPVPEVEPQYVEKEDGVLVSDQPQPRPSSVEVNRAVESNAVELVKKAFEASGWSFHRDRQKDGVGYDLEFVKGEQRRNVEVKGIRGDRLEFNVTRKEFHRAQTDPYFVLVAVTGALDEDKRKVQVVSRETVVEAPRIPLGYRVRPGAVYCGVAGEGSWH